jgi:wyosine [tRNA(Phe)-imidazoG37] synthetase (radical SAM superfamily)
VLRAFNQHNDYFRLTREVKQISEKLQAAQKNSWQSVDEAIKAFFARDQITQPDFEFLNKLHEQNDPHIVAIWEVFQLLRDEQDMLESFQVLMRTKKIILRNNLIQRQAYSATVIPKDERNVSSQPVRKSLSKRESG